MVNKSLAIARIYHKIRSNNKFKILALILLGSFVLLFKINSYPKSLYNWEHYTVWRIFIREQVETQEIIPSYFKIDDGLISTSGDSPFVGGVIQIISNLFGMELGIIRIWPVFTSIVSLVIFYLLAKRFSNNRTASLACLFLLGSQAYLFYSRTATNIIISLPFFLITIYLLIRVTDKKTPFYIYLSLAAILFINSYLYATIRFLLPLSIIIVIIKNIYYFNKKKFPNKARRKNIATIILLGSLSLLAFYFLLSDSDFLFKRQILNYYNGRGEHVGKALKEAKNLDKVGFDNVSNYVLNNSLKFTKLYLNIETKAIMTDYWNNRGQIINSMLVPFFLLGIIKTTIKFKKNKNYLLLIWFCLMSFPIILTSNVHVARLFFSLPAMYIMTADGLMFTCQLFKKTLSKKLSTKKALIINNIFLISFCYFVFASEIITFYTSRTIPDTVTTKVSQFLEKTDQDKTIVMANFNAESLLFWQIYFYLQKDYQFINADQIGLSHLKEGNNKTIYYIDRKADQTPEEYFNPQQNSLVFLGTVPYNIYHSVIAEDNETNVLIIK
jgi:4-amino-4-deoxy-L-arabinose transferase-like glycosyltransferase